MTVLHDPWRRPKTPVSLPSFSRATDLRALTTDELAEAIRDHLEPRGTDGKYVAQWRNFWAVMSFDHQLNETAVSILEEFIAQCEVAADNPDLDEHQQKRAVKFADRCVKALDRLDRADQEPLAWAGAQAASFNPRAREVIEILVRAISDHRANHDDETLWSVLDRVHLNPDANRQNRT